MSGAVEAIARARGTRGLAWHLSAPRALRAIVRRGLLDRRRSVLAWGISGGLMCAFMAALYPSVQGSIGKAVASYPKGLKDAFGIGRLSSVEQFLSAEAFGLIVPLAMAFFAIRSVVRALPAAEESHQLDTLLSAPVSRTTAALAAFATTGLALAAVLTIVGAFTWIGAQLAGADLSAGSAIAGVANVWPLALLFAGLTVVVTGLCAGSGRATGIASGALLAMYVVDLLGKLADSLDGLRYLSIFRYYGKAIEDGIDPLAFAGITVCAVALAGLGAWLFERRDILG